MQRCALVPRSEPQRDPPLSSTMDARRAPSLPTEGLLTCRSSMHGRRTPRRLGTCLDVDSVEEILELPLAQADARRSLLDGERPAEHAAIETLVELAHAGAVAEQ